MTLFRFRLVPIVALAALLIALSLPARAPAETHRVEDAQTGWLWYSGYTVAELSQIVDDENMRIIDIEPYDPDEGLFTAAMVRNSGVYDSGWWWYVNITYAQVIDFIDQNDGRLIDIERYIVDGQERFAVVMVPNTGDQAKTWYWFVGVTPNEITDYINRYDARLVDIESYDVPGAGRRYATIMIENTGDDAAGWGWFHNVDRATLIDWMNENGMRLLEFEVRDGSEERFDAVLVSLDHHTPKTWWWWYNVAASEINGLIDQHASRITDIDSYFIGNQRRYNLVMLSNANDLTVEMGHILEWGSDGNTGAFLKEVDGQTLATLNPDFVFEPASTIKAVHHLHTVRSAEAGATDLADDITYSENYSGSCPIGGAPFTTVSIEEALRRMMVNSDNAATEGIAQLFGAAAINNTAQNVAGMDDTSINHTLGCASGAIADPNQLTLRDITGMYEGVQNTTLLGEPWRDTYYDLMQNQDTPAPWWFTTDLENTVQEEATAIGAPHIADSFWANVRTAWKPGGYTLIVDGDNHEYVSVAGVVSLPLCDGWPDLRYKHYVFGVFVDDGSNNSDTFDRVRDAAKELLRDVVAEALISCPTSVDQPLPEPGVALEANFPNPFNPSTTIAYNLDRAQTVTLAVFDAAGRRVAELAGGHHAAGRYAVQWDGRDRTGRMASAGIYFARLVTEDGVEQRKMALIK
ncbi:T9SS type A sorting domain-containing protein [bacterium]|nr:T9SS type A sorting domain-containing protein [bacterium]